MREIGRKGSVIVLAVAPLLLEEEDEEGREIGREGDGEAGLGVWTGSEEGGREEGIMGLGRDRRSEGGSGRGGGLCGIGLI